MNEDWDLYERAVSAKAKAEGAGFSLDCIGDYICVKAHKKPYVNGVTLARAKTFGGVEDFLAGYRQKELELEIGGEVK